MECINVKSLPRLKRAIIEEHEKRNGGVWIIWSEEHRAWWAPNHRGYVKNRNKAGRYSFEDATKIVSGANIGLKDVPNEAMVMLSDEEL